jgi:hypothetical protein
MPTRTPGSSPTARLPWVQATADREPPSTREAPEVWAVSDATGVHQVVAYARRCLVLRADAVGFMTRDSMLLIWSWPRGARGRVYAFSFDELHEAWREQMRTPSYVAKGWYGFTPENPRFDRYLVRYLRAEHTIS